MSDWQQRTMLAAGVDKVALLKKSSVAVFGLGGVGSFACEALARAGVGKLVLVDSDRIDITNINRQLYALHSTVGQSKVALAAARCLDINPGLELVTHEEWITKESISGLIAPGIDFAIDAIDTMPHKIDLLEALYLRNIHTVSSMGSARRFEPGRVKIADISKTHGCPLARDVRKQLKVRGILKGISCVFSDEPAAPVVNTTTQDSKGGRTPLGSISYMPPIFGMMAAGEIIRTILGSDQNGNIPSC